MVAIIVRVGKIEPSGYCQKYQAKYTCYRRYISFTLTGLMTNDFQVEFFSFNNQKQWKLSVCKKVINQVRVNAL